MTELELNFSKLNSLYEIYKEKRNEEHLNDVIDAVTDLMSSLKWETSKYNTAPDYLIREKIEGDLVG